MISEECRQWKGVEQVRRIYNKRTKVLTAYFCSRESSGVSGRISKHFVRKQSRRLRCSSVQSMCEVSINKSLECSGCFCGPLGQPFAEKGNFLWGGLYTFLSIFLATLTLRVTNRHRFGQCPRSN